MNGSIFLLSTASVGGPVETINGRIDRQPGSLVGGRVAAGADTGTPSWFRWFARIMGWALAVAAWFVAPGAVPAWILLAVVVAGVLVVLLSLNVSSRRSGTAAQR